MFEKLLIGSAIAVIVFGILFCVVNSLYYVEQSNSIAVTDEVLYNPYIGFAVNADYEGAVGENTLVYVDITWAEWEPQKDSYAFDEVWESNNLSKWQAEGKHVVLRFICDKPDEDGHMDIPQWLYEETGDGVFYDISYGKGYSPEYTNEVFIERHRETILALGKAFSDKGIVAYVEMGSLGHWGEWHTKYSDGLTRMPSSEVRESYVSAYEEAFPDAYLMARRPFAETAKRNFGLFNDMTGHPDSTAEWLGWITSGGEYDQPLVPEKLIAQPEVWKTSPIGGEFTSSLGYDEMLVDRLDDTIALLKTSHTSFIGPKCPVVEEVETYSSGVEKVLKTIGYRYSVAETHISYWKWLNRGNMSLKIKNAGIAPIYFPWKMYLYIYDETGELLERRQVPVELMELTGGDSTEVNMKNVPFKEGYSYWVGVEDPDEEKAAMYLDMECETKDFQYQIITLQ